VKELGKRGLGKKGRAIRMMRAMRTMRAIRAIRARRKMGAMRKTLSNISLLTINRNLTPCQALQYTKYHLVELVEPVREPVRSFKWAIGWLQRSNL